MRIGVDAREWVAGRQTGIGRYLETLLQRAIEQRPELDWTLFQHPGDVRRVEAPQISYVEMPRRGAPLVDQVELPRCLRRARPEVFFSPFPKSPWSAPCPVIVVVHDLHPLVLPASLGGLRGARRAWYRWYVGRSVRRATRVVTDSGASARDITHHLGIPEHRIEVIHLAVDPTLLCGGGDVDEGTEVAGRYFLVVGILRAHKNQSTVLRAWARVQGRADDRLVLAGSGPDASALDRLAAELGIHDRVLSLGRVDDDRLRRLYRGAMALLQPSIIEGFGLPVVEAMALGTPAIVSSGGSLPEVAGGAAPVVEADDVDGWAKIMQRFLSDPDYRGEWAAKARERATAFRHEQTTDVLLDLIERSGRTGV